MIPVITAITESYLPGLKALANSFKANAGPGFQLHCICFGDGLSAQVEALGVVAMDPPAWNVNYPTSRDWPEPTLASYVRLLVPTLFARFRRAIWIDADCVIVKPLAPLADLEFHQPVAAVYFSGVNYRLDFQAVGVPPELGAVRCTFNGLLVFNVAEWNRRNITEQCTEVMNTAPYEFRFIDQAVLSYVLRGDFYHLGKEWQIFANRADADIAGARILHWVGGLPWRDAIPHADIWRRHYESAPA